jgi:phosphonopyruvate decarboxylase
MIQPKVFFDAISSRGVSFYTGVPDSLLANFCFYLDDHSSNQQHIIVANEGNAVALAMGFHMSTGKLGMVYMQNSGLGNIVNPLTSLVDPEVYKVPMLLVIGWRGEPGVDDEPQHIKQGQVTLPQLDILEIPNWVVDAKSDINSVLDDAFACMNHRNAPVALVIRKDTFEKYTPNNSINQISNFLREDALELILQLCSEEDLIVSTTGKTSREVYELRVKNGQSQRDFLTVGGMGHASSIALGVAVGQPQRRIVCLDGDGSMIMHMGSMPVIAKFKPKKFIHVLLNNCSHESVGGQPTSANVIDFQKLSAAVGYKAYAVASDIQSLKDAWRSLINDTGPVLLEVKIRNGSREDLGRPKSTAEQNKIAFMEIIGV